MIAEFILNKLLQENPSFEDDDLAVVEYVFKLLSERCALLVNALFFYSSIILNLIVNPSF